MTKHAYSPATGELIRTETPADWMGTTDVAPPAFDAQTAGCFWRGTAWEVVQAAPAAAPVPQTISPRQIRQALTRAGLRTQVEAAIAAADQDTKDWYEFATAFERLNSHVIAMGHALGQTDAQLDALWALGAGL